ncbi:MAG: sigma 54-interacting transcriptional regulator [Thermodesulfobacteriota bacterium]
MAIDMNTILQKMRRINNETDIQKVLSDTFGYISKIAPLWKMSWLQYHQDLRLVRIIAQALPAGGELTNFMYETSKEIMDLACSGENPDIYIVNRPEKDPVGSEISARARHFEWSAVFVIFKNASGAYGSAMITAEGKDRFTEEHSRRLLALKEPLGLVLDILIKNHEKKNLPPSRKEPVEDKNEFFRQVTRRLCGHLDLESGLAGCLQYLSRFLPADGLFVRQVEPELLSERILAESYGFFRPQSESLVPLAADDSLFKDGRELLETRIINQPDHHPFAKTYTQLFGEDISFIAMPLIHKENRLGIAVLGLEGRQRYTEEHRRLFEMLHDPFVLALANNIKHREVLRLKEMIEAEKKDLQEELQDTRSQAIIGAGLGLKEIMENARLVAYKDSPVLLRGETGVGKELIANFIHRKSARNHGPFIKVNCGAIPDTLVDSELFGHEKGAFTGATSRKKGRFDRASGGTIFLDEIGELPLPAQVRLLRVLQNKVIERVGGTETIPVDVRIIAATHRNLEEMVASGKFREDLWFRLNVFPIRIPPLRSRQTDIPALVDYFIETKSRELKLSHKPSLSFGAMGRLTAYEWPGNIRELKNVIERELIVNRGEALSFQSIEHMPSKDSPADNVFWKDNVLGLDEIFTRHVKKVLSLTNGKVEGPGGAAELLNINPSTLRTRMRKLKIPFGVKSSQDHLPIR